MEFAAESRSVDYARRNRGGGGAAAGGAGGEASRGPRHHLCLIGAWGIPSLGAGGEASRAGDAADAGHGCGGVSVHAGLRVNGASSHLRGCEQAGRSLSLGGECVNGASSHLRGLPTGCGGVCVRRPGRRGGGGAARAGGRAADRAERGGDGGGGGGAAGWFLHVPPHYTIPALPYCVWHTLFVSHVR